MTFTHLSRGHLLALCAEFQLASTRLLHCARDPDRQNQLPGQLHDCNHALAAIINHAAAADPLIAQALATGRRLAHE